MVFVPVTGDVEAPADPHHVVTVELVRERLGIPAHRRCIERALVRKNARDSIRKQRTSVNRAR